MFCRQVMKAILFNMNVTPDGSQLVSGFVHVELGFKCSVLLSRALRRTSPAFAPISLKSGCSSNESLFRIYKFSQGEHGGN